MNEFMIKFLYPSVVLPVQVIGIYEQIHLRFASFCAMEKKRPARGVSNSIQMFNFISKLVGFAVVSPDIPFLSRSIREILLISYLLLSTGCSIRSELWCMFVLKVDFTERKFIIFVLTQIIVVSTFMCLFLHRLNNAKIWDIMVKIRSLEDSLIMYSINLDIFKMGFYGLTFSFLHLFLILSTMYYMISYYPINLLVDSTCVFYFEIWVAVPCLQFIGWISLLSYVLYCLQCRIIQLNDVDWSIQLWNGFGLKKHKIRKWNDLNNDHVIKIKHFIVILKQVMEMATELAAAYGILVLIFMCNYLARVIAQCYDIIKDDSQRFPIGIGIWNGMSRMAFILPIFVCCEIFNYNVNKTVHVIEIITLQHHPSSLDIVFQCLTLRLRHKTPIIKVCGVLNVTYRSFLTIMTASVAFLVLQLQSV